MKPGFATEAGAAGFTNSTKIRLGARRRRGGYRSSRRMTSTSGPPSTARPLNYRNDLSPVRSSSTKSFGCSQAAKWPP
jgi:hypothetical protein